LRTVDDLVGHFLAAMRGEAVHEDGVGLGARHQRFVDLEGLRQMCRFVPSLSPMGARLSVTAAIGAVPPAPDCW
jgi:hypothetical protein